MKQVVATSTQLSHVLKSARHARRMTQGEAGKLVGLLPKTISALENHPGTVSIDVLYKLLSALDLELVVATKTSAAAEQSEAYGDPGEW